jgi:Ca2+-binding RTX toxin-like protein
MKLANHDGDDRIVGTSGRDSIEGLTLGDNLIIGNGGQDIIIAGNGNNQIYANTQVDLATALTQQKNITTQKGDVIGVGDGNNTIVGGDGNDAIFTGNGHNTIVCGAGENTVTGGLEVYSAALNWFSQTNNFEPYQIFFWDIKGYGAPPMAGVGNDTIFGGTGNSVYWLSNGNNWLDAGGGMFGEAANDLEWKIAA